MQYLRTSLRTALVLIFLIASRGRLTQFCSQTPATHLTVSIFGIASSQNHEHRINRKVCSGIKICRNSHEFSVNREELRHPWSDQDRHILLVATHELLIFEDKRLATEHVLFREDPVTLCIADDPKRSFTISFSST